MRYLNKFSKCNSFQVTTNLLNSENLKAAIAQLCNDRATGLQLYYVISDPKVGEQHMYTKFSECNSFQVSSDSLNSDYLKVAIAQLCNVIQV